MELVREYSPDLKVSQALAHFDELRLEFLNNEKINHGEKISLVAHARIMSSNSLQKKGDLDLDRWNSAQAFVFLVIQNKMAWETILELNSLLTGNEKEACERKVDIYAGGAAFVDTHHKDKLLQVFKLEVLPNLEAFHPIIASTLLRYWIVSLHPFCDGNGRVAQTVGDAWLLKYNYPPLVFKNSFQGQFAKMPGIREDFAFEDALESSFAGLANAFSLINSL